MTTPPPKKKIIRWKSEKAILRTGVELVDHITAMEAVAVDDPKTKETSIIYVFPKWGPNNTRALQESIIAGLGGRRVFVEVKASFELTGNYCEYGEYGR